MFPIDGHRFDVAHSLLLSPGTQIGVGGKMCAQQQIQVSRLGACPAGESRIFSLVFLPLL